MPADTPNDDRLDSAVKRLDRAVTLLERRLATRLAEAGATAEGLVDHDRSHLAAELDASRARERELAEAGAQASAALARAIAEIRGALDRT